MKKCVTNDTSVTNLSAQKFGGIRENVYFCKKINAMSNMNSSYRPHDPGHDYYAPGVYLITLVVRNRERNHELLGRLNNDVKAPAVVLSEIGKAVEDCWHLIPEIQARHGRKVRIHAAVCMPDHFHGVIEVLEKMDRSVGEVICGFKIGCTKAWREIQAGRPPFTAADTGGDANTDGNEPYMALANCCKPSPDLHRLSHRQRAEYYAAHPEAAQPLWDDNYDDTICLTDANGNPDARHFSAMTRYVADNPRRAVIRRARPEFMRRCLHVVIGGRDYAAFGNLFLLRWARKVQVFCHRKAPDGRTPYERTDAYRRECMEWKRMVMQGATAIVTPGISMGERMIKDRCIERGYPLIHLQKEAIGSYWKPELRRFEACAGGALLILAPWKPETIGEVNGVPSDTDYSIFHNLNHLAEEICAFEGEARVIG